MGTAAGMRGSSLAERSQSGPRDHDGDLPAIGGGAPMRHDGGRWPVHRSPPSPRWPSAWTPMPGPTGPSWPPCRCGFAVSSPTSTGNFPTGRCFLCAGCAMADQPALGASPSTSPAAAATRTRCCPPAASPAAPRTPSTARAASTCPGPCADTEDWAQPTPTDLWPGPLSESCWAALCTSSRSFLLARSCGSRLGSSRPSSGSSCCRERVRAIPASFLRNLSPFLPSTAGHQITTTQATINQLRATSTVTALDPWQGYGCRAPASQGRLRFHAPRRGRRGRGVGPDPPARVFGWRHTPCPRSMVMTGPVSEWEFWTDMVFPETGNCVVPLGLVDIDRAKDTGDGDGQADFDAAPAWRDENDMRRPAQVREKGG